MTDNTTNQGGSDTGSALIAFDSADEHAGLPEELTEIDDYADELTEIDDDDSGGDGVPRTGAVRGGFGFAGLALAIVSLTTNWTSGVVVSHGQYSEEMNAPSSGLTVQQELNMYANAWHTQGWWALVFAAAAVLFERSDRADIEPVVTWFDQGGALKVGIDERTDTCWRGFQLVPGLFDLARDAGLADDSDREITVAACEVILDALVAQQRIARSDEHGWQRARARRKGGSYGEGDALG